MILYSNVSEPPITILYSSFQDAHHLYLVMEFCDGGDLRGLLDNSDELAEADVKGWVAEIVRGVGYVFD